MDLICLAILLSFMAGMIFGKVVTDTQWRLKGNPEYRTAMNSGGKFWYVVSEKEYCDKFLTKWMD